jgi:hypothetical protein
MLQEISQLLARQHDEKLNIIRDRSVYSTERKDLVSRVQVGDYVHPLVYTINKNNEPTLFYTNDNTRGHFGRSKFIFSNGAGFYCDMDGNYGMTEWAYCIYDIAENLPRIKNAFLTPRFEKLKRAIQLDSQTYNVHILKDLRKDFWRDFV